MIYLYIPEASRVDFFDVYGKDEKDDLKPSEKKLLADLAKLVKLQAIEEFQRSGGKR